MKPEPPVTNAVCTAPDHTSGTWPTSCPRPAGRLSPRARSVWRAEWAATCRRRRRRRAPALRSARRRRGRRWCGPSRSLAAGRHRRGAGLRWRRWRWEVREEEIDIDQGILLVRRTLIPMPRVQHVETTRNVLEQALRLATVKVHTAAGGHTIPLLDERDAARVRDRIAVLARTEAGLGAGAAPARCVTGARRASACTRRRSRSTRCRRCATARSRCSSCSSSRSPARGSTSGALWRGAAFAVTRHRRRRGRRPDPLGLDDATSVATR